jgi:hypothetical protein
MAKAKKGSQQVITGVATGDVGSTVQQFVNAGAKKVLSEKVNATWTITATF